ncbi:SAM-dependent chlorinase/fluorinase [bacterium]|nr:SAM-dependent chlorinase/fluorinase [bacterium]
MRARIILTCAVLTLSISACAAGEGFELRTGELEGVPYALAVPQEWNGTLLLQAHGSRSPDAPLLADLDVEDPANLALLDDGWLIAFSAYRRNGPIVLDAAYDLLALRAHVAATYGAPGRVLVEGWSMGAAVATVLVELHAGQIDGACAVGPRYSRPVPGEDLNFTREPRRPLLLLSNMGESADARAYQKAATEAGASAVFWTVGRYGHVNLNAAERLEALRALSDWVTRDLKPEPRELLVVMTPESVAARDEGAISANVLSIDPVYSNLETSFVPGDLAWLGVAEGGLVRIVAAGGSTGALYGKSYNSVAPDRGVIFPNAEGRLTIAVNRGSAVERLGCVAGDILTVSPWDGTGRP